jgi:aspartate dehydrogenase
VTQVAVLGCGAIGGPTARALRDGAVPGAGLAGVVTRGAGTPSDLPALTLADALAVADLVVEAAGHDALAALGPQVLAAGKDLLVVSTGALADDAVFAALTGPHQGRLHLSSGAVGGLDLLAAAGLMGPWRSVCLTTTKKPAGLVQPWMSAEQACRVREATEPVELMRGPAREVARAFPKSANVAASVALAIGAWDVVQAVVVADPAASLTSHVITADGAAGHYRFEMSHHPSTATRTTSGMVPYAVLRSIAAIVGQQVMFR